MFERQYDEAVLVEVYLKTNSQYKAAEICGCSRETVARAVRRAGIPLNGRKYNGGTGGSPAKITDEELIEESKTMTRAEIAKKHGMNVCNVDRKLSRLKISCVKAQERPVGSVGRLGSSHHYRERAYAYGVEYEEGISLKKVMLRDKGICQLCGKPVDKTDIRQGHVGLLYPSIDHIIPLSKGGGHTWNNVQLAHMVCNSTKCDRVEVRTWI